MNKQRTQFNICYQKHIDNINGCTCQIKNPPLLRMRRKGGAVPSLQNISNKLVAIQHPVMALMCCAAVQNIDLIVYKYCQTCSIYLKNTYNKETDTCE